jgi:hypothetical protein
LSKVISDVCYLAVLIYTTVENAFYQWLKGRRLPRQNTILVAIDAAWQSQPSMLDTRAARGHREMRLFIPR